MMKMNANEKFYFRVVIEIIFLKEFNTNIKIMSKRKITFSSVTYMSKIENTTEISFKMIISTT